MHNLVVVKGYKPMYLAAGLLGASHVLPEL